MSKNLWIIIFVVMIIVLVSSLFFGPGLLNPKGKFTRDEFTAAVGAPTNITRSLVPPIPAAGEEIQVFLTVSLGGADTYFIDEIVPAGLAIVSTGGGTQSVSPDGKTHIRYGAFSGATGTPTHFYVLKIPLNVDPTYAFFGEFTFGKGTNQVDQITVIAGVDTITFQNGTLIVNANKNGFLFINANPSGTLNPNQAGTPSLTKTLLPGNYTVAVENISGFVKMEPLLVSVLPGKTANITCTYLEADPADTDENGVIRPGEMNAGISLFLNNQPDAKGRLFTLSTLAKSISRFFLESYHPKTDQCKIVIL